MSNEFLLNLLVSAQHQMLALAQSLDILKKHIERQEKQETSTANGNSNLIQCPACNLVCIDPEVHNITCMGDKREQYGCPECNFQGPI